MPPINHDQNIRGPWSLAEAVAFMHETNAPMRLAVNGASGFPILTPLWHIWIEGALWAAAKPNSAIVRALRRDPRCAFDISIETPPYKGVRGRGHAKIETNGVSLLQRLIERYMGSEAPNFQARLLRSSKDENAICIQPTQLTSWDFSKRMGN
ncbi:MAG: pyridoxamine 5'-phosphate oxidase family protein [Alphaproteobacteria bacterium]